MQRPNRTLLIIDSLIDDDQIKQDRFIRYYDDIEYGCEEEGEAHKVLGLFVKMP